MQNHMTECRRGSLGRAVAIGFGVTAALFAAAIGSWLFATPRQVKIVEAHLAALRARDIDGAYKDIGSAGMSKEYIQALLDHNPQVFDSGRVSVTPDYIDDSCGDKSARIQATIVGTDGKTYAITYELRGNRGWTIAEILSSDLTCPPAPVAIQGPNVSATRGNGGTEVRIDFMVLGWDTYRWAERWEYDVVLRTKLDGPAGRVIQPVQEVGRYEHTQPWEDRCIPRVLKFILPDGEKGEYKATVVLENVLTGRVASQVIPFQIP